MRKWRGGCVDVDGSKFKARVPFWRNFSLLHTLRARRVGLARHQCKPSRSAHRANIKPQIVGRISLVREREIEGKRSKGCWSRTGAVLDAGHVGHSGRLSRIGAKKDLDRDVSLSCSPSPLPLSLSSQANVVHLSPPPRPRRPLCHRSAGRCSKTVAVHTECQLEAR